MAYNSNRGFSSVSNPRAGVTIDGLDEMVTRLTVMEAKLKDVQPILQDITKEFAFMEAQRFRNSGRAPQYGIYEQWQPIDKRTRVERDAAGLPGREPLVAFGYLEKAATNPTVKFVGGRSVEWTIDPREHGAPSDYSEGQNYGTYHQAGGDREEGNNRPQRQFVNLTPAFMKYAKMIIMAHLEGEITGNRPEYKSIGTRGGKRHAPRQKRQSMKNWKKSKAEFRGHTSNLKTHRPNAPKTRDMNAERRIEAYINRRVDYGEFALRKGYSEHLGQHDPLAAFKNPSTDLRRTLAEREKQAYEKVRHQVEVAKTHKPLEALEEAGISLETYVFHKKVVEAYNDPGNMMARADWVHPDWKDVAEKPYEPEF